MKRQILIGIAVVVLIAGGIAINFFVSDRNISDGTRKVPTISSLGDSKFDLQADSSGSLGVDVNSTFTLSSNEPVEADLIMDNLAIEPSFTYRLESSDNNMFTLIPQEQLKEKTIYHFSIATQPEGSDKIREYNWAYQTKETFKITGTLPRDEATSVPVDTGIEIIFSHENFTQYEDYIAISPDIDGRFEKYRKTLVFIPESLEAGSLYTVTIGQGLSLENSDLTLAEDYTFQFETNGLSRDEGYLYFEKDFFEYPPDEAPILSLHEHGTGLSSVTVAAYAFSTFNDFTDAVQARDTIPYWATYARRNNLYPIDSLQLAATFEATIQTSDNVQYIEFPEALARSPYLVDVTYGDRHAQIFLQIQSLAASFQASEQNAFIWAHDLETGNPLSGASVIFSHNNDFSKTLNPNGLVEFEVPKELQVTSYPIIHEYYFVLDYNGNKLLIPTERHRERGFYMSTADPDYWAYLYANRTLYAPTDSIKFWGLIKPRTGNTNSLTLNVRLTKNYYVRGANNVEIQSQILKTSSFGTFMGEMDYSNLTPGYYYLEVKVGDERIVGQGLNIATYTKPPYKIEVTSDKKAIFEGDDVTFNIQAMFFDGTPLKDFELEYSGSFGTGQVTTDANGEVQVTKSTAYSGSNWYPQYEYFSVSPVQSEIADISSSAHVYAFGPAYGITVDTDKSGVISGEVRETTLDTINGPESKFDWNFEGDPVADISVTLEIYHEYYTRTETGMRYDFINKKTYKTYDYQHHSDLIQEANTITGSDGTYEYTFAVGQDKNYKITARVTDGQGREAQYSSFLNNTIGYNYWSSQGYDNYHLETDIDSPYQPGQEIAVSYYNRDDQLPNLDTEQFVFFKTQSKIMDISLSAQSNTTLVYQESYAPNIFMYGLYFDGRSYHLSNALNLKYDSSLKQLDIQIEQDKAEYRPGETATITVQVQDADGNPVEAEVNLSMIDEALAAIQWRNPASILSTVYRILSPSLKYSYQSHERALSPQAEGGGCFTADTQILMRDGTTKPISEVAVGDYVLTFDSANQKQLTAARVERVFEHFVSEHLVINNNLRLTPEHIILLNNEWQPVHKATIGDTLLDGDGIMIDITKISKSYSPAKVYNLNVEGQHTFIANGIYVHNSKDAMRDNFQDIAFFGSKNTNANGQVVFTVDLPDNITAWHTTVHAVTQDLAVSADQTAVISTLPFFVDATLATDYLVGDKPIIRINGVGSQVQAGDAIEYEISYSDDTFEITSREGTAYEPLEIALPEGFAAGEHYIQIRGKTGSYEDAITKNFIFHDSYVLQNAVNFYTVEPGLAIEGSDTLNTQLTFSNKERGQYYNALKRMQWTYGDRIDQVLARKMSTAMLVEYFDESVNVQDDFIFISYQLPEGGISLLPYSSVDPLLTAKVLEVGKSWFDQEAVIQYFESILDNTDSNSDEIVYALLGLANLQEPVLTDINLYLANNDIVPELKIYLIRAIANLGAVDYAVSLLDPILQEHGEYSKPYLKLNLGETLDDAIEYSYQAAIVYAGVSSDYAGQLFSFALANRAELQLNELEKISYVAVALSLLSADPVSFTYTMDGQARSVSLKNNETESILVTPEQLAGITFSNIGGSVGVIASYQEPIILGEADVDESIGIKRRYYVNGQQTTSFQENDIVKITLTPRIAGSAMDTEYQITDHLPSGLKLLTYRANRNLLTYDPDRRYPYEVNKQTVKFWTGKPTEQFNYYALVSTKGEFRADPPAIQGFVVQDSKNYGASQTVIIK